MNATSLSELRNGAVIRDPSDEKMDQIRELLIGEYTRRSETRIAELEARLQALEKDLVQRYDAIASRRSPAPPTRSGARAWTNWRAA